MYQKKHKKISWEKILKILFLAVIITLSSVYVTITVVFSSMKNEFDVFFNGFDVESSLIEEKYVDVDFLEERAEQFEDLLGTYHIPHDMTGEGWDYYPPVGVCWQYSKARFYNNSELLDTFDPLDRHSPYNDKDNMTFCGDRGHTALYEGVYCAGEAFRYAWAKRNGDKGTMNAARQRILKIMKAYDLLSNVSSRSAFVRYAVPNTTKAKQKFPGHWESEDHYVVEYKGYKWSLSRHLSRDVSIGIMFGLSMSYYFVEDAEIRSIAGRIIDKTVQYWHDCNWRIVDTDGAQHTSGDFVAARPMVDGASQLTFLQMGKMVNPDKWGPVYEHSARDRGLANTIGRSLRMGVDLAPKVYDAYYGCNFIYNNAPTLILLEKDPLLRKKYIENWLNVMHDFAKLHRNANFDVVWLLCHSEIQEDKYETPTITLDQDDLEIWKKANIQKPQDKEYIKNFCVRDIKDCLTRYAIRRYPNRNYYWATAPGTFPNKYQQKIVIDGDAMPYPEYDYWQPDTNMGEFIKTVLTGAGREIDEENILKNYLPTNMRKTEDIMWQRRSFTVKTTERIPTEPGTFQAPAGPEYLAVYWMAKYLELF